MKLKKLLIVAALLLGGTSVLARQGSAPGKRERESLPLAGIWQFKLDPTNVAIPVKGSRFTPQLPETITLPGSTDQAGKGYKTQDMTSIRLTRMFEYAGAAWYEKQNVFIPEEWRGKRIFIHLERAHWEVRAWVNGHAVGREMSLSTPHEFDITDRVKFGERNTVRFRVDNSKIFNLEYTHAVSAETQTNWNGIIGDMEIRAYDQVRMADIQLYPDRKGRKVKVDVTLANPQKRSVEGEIALRCSGGNGGSDTAVQLPLRTYAFSGSDSVFVVSYEYALGDKVLLWDEFTPNLYRAEFSMTASDGKDAFADETSETFGVRDLATEGTRLTINDRILFLRGNVNSAEFPITGYPPMDYDEWFRILKVCRDYGLNSVRFHSWCPPEAAFEAADRLGLYLQVENSDWRFTIGTVPELDAFFFDEASRIFREYGNHPSFAFFCEGNELVGPGRDPVLKKMLEQWKKDPRHLYAAASGYPNIEGSDFFDYYGPRPQRWQEGLKGRFNVAPLNTMYDYSDYVKKVSVPLITHEIGQWCNYPDFNQVGKYTGVLKPYNYEIFREGLRDKNMLDQAWDFHIASGKFQVIQKKEEFESYFRTPGFGGYTLLQINDFPGQGTSPVGVVDVFYDAKPYVTAEEFRRMQGTRVPLLRAEKFTWTNGETFTGKAQIVNFSDRAVRNGRVEWSLKYPDVRVYRKGGFRATDIPVGPITELGEVSIPLSGIREAVKMTLTFSLAGTDVFNEWAVWVYPQRLPETQMDGVVVAREWNAAVRQRLLDGATVFLMADPERIDSDVPPGFSGISWNAVWSGTPPNLLGILCDPEHPALREFPTEFHSNWQWFDMVRYSRPMVLDHTPALFRPVVQMIPDWNNNRKIGLIIEARVGKGKLLMTSIDLEGIREKSPVARQMLHSLERYVAGEGFAPTAELTPEMIDKLFRAE